MKRISIIATWSFSIILAVLFEYVGSSKLFGSSADHWNKRFMNWGYPSGAHYAVGLMEVIGGLMLLLPRSRRIGSIFLIVVMAGASGTHLIHGELPRVIPPLVLALLLYLLSRTKSDPV